MGVRSRRKGAAGERELCSLLETELGPVARRLGQARDGGHDLEGLSLTGWAIEVKRHAEIPPLPPHLSSWWAQAEAQAASGGLTPVLMYRGDRQAWRVVVPLWAVHPGFWKWGGLEWTVTMSLEAWCAVARERLGGSEDVP